MGLFTPAWKSDNEEKALAFIEKCDNQEKLKIIALEKNKGPDVLRLSKSLQIK